MSIRTKLVIFFCLAGLIPALVLFTLAWKSTIKVEETMSTQFTGIAADTLDKVERNLFERYGDVQAFGYNRVVHDKEQWYKADREQNAISRVMDDYMAAYGIYSLMILVDTQGKPIAINSKDSAGKPLNTAPLFEKRYDQAKWFTNAMAGRYLTDGKSGITGTVVEDVAIDPDVAALYGDEGLAMQFAAPVKNEAGEVVAVWVNYAKWSLVEEILIGTYETMKSNGWPNSELTLLDNEGNILIDCDPKAHGGFKRDMDGVFMKLNLAQKGVEAAKLAVAGQNGSIRSLHARKNVWQTAAYAHSSGALGYPGMGWSLLVRVPETDSLASVRTAQATLLTVLGVAVPAVLGLAFFLARVFVRPIRTLCAAVREIAQGDGDLTRRVELNSKDELGVLARDLNAFITMLHDLVARISATASEVGGATKQVEEAGRTMAQAVNEQAEQTTQTSTAVEEMSASIVEVARKAADSATNASKARDGAVEGAEVVRGVVESIRGIASTVTGSSAAIDGLGKRGEQIGSIIETIEEIADQTNLLALNAAIEAARAGDHGRGFAVVADEVRKLAERTMKATQEVSQSIMGIQSDTKQAIGKMAECSEAVQRGVSLAQKAGQSLDHITRGSEEISGMVQSIAAATEEQSAASEEITRNISGMAESGRQNAEQAELVSSCADSLSRSSSALLELVGRFKTAAPGGSAHS